MAHSAGKRQRAWFWYLQERAFAGTEREPGLIPLTEIKNGSLIQRHMAGAGFLEYVPSGTVGMISARVLPPLSSWLAIDSGPVGD